jgi:tetratricopeptide (TPR) repeat protein
LYEQIEFLQKAIQYDTQAEFKVPMGYVHFNLAGALKTLGKTKDAAYHIDKAKDLLQKQVQNDPQSAKAYSYLGYCFVETRNFKAAAPLFKRALELRPLLYARYIELALSYKMLGRVDEAIEVVSAGRKFMLSNNRPADAAILEKFLQRLKSQKLEESQNKK